MSGSVESHLGLASHDAVVIYHYYFSSRFRCFFGGGAVRVVRVPLTVEEYLASRAISQSALDTFDKCPAQFAFKYLRSRGFGARRAATSRILAEGRALHKAIEDAYAQQMETGGLVSLADLEASALNSFKSEIGRGNDSLVLTKKLMVALHSFYKNIYVPERFIPVAVEKGGEVFIENGLRFIFRVDLIARDSRSGDLCVVDFKIGRPYPGKSRVAEGLQTLAYSWALDIFANFQITRAYRVFFGADIEELVPVNEELKLQFRRTILKLVEVIRKTTHYRAKPSRFNCSTCDFRLVCPESIAI